MIALLRLLPIFVQYAVFCKKKNLSIIVIVPQPVMHLPSLCVKMWLTYLFICMTPQKAGSSDGPPVLVRTVT